MNLTYIVTIRSFSPAFGTPLTKGGGLGGRTSGGNPSKAVCKQPVKDGVC
jgi:hypothetical protein